MKQFILLCLIPIFICSSLEAAKKQSPMEIVDTLIICMEKEQQVVANQLDAVDQSSDEAAYRALQTKVGNYERGLTTIRSLKPTIQQAQWASLSSNLSRSNHIQSSLTGDCSKYYLQFIESVETEKKAGYAKFEEELAAFTAKLGANLLEAKDPADLDAYYIEVEALKARANEFRSYSNNNHSSTTNNLTQIVSGWQDYLNALSIGDKKSAESCLRNLNRSLTTTPVVPRSAVLQLQNELKLGVEAAKRAQTTGSTDKPLPPFTVESVVGKIRTIEDMKIAETKLIELTQYKETKSEASSQLSNIQGFDAAIRLMEEDNPLLALNSVAHTRATGRLNQWLPEIKNQIRTRALEQSIPAVYRVKVSSDLSLEAFIKQSGENMMNEGDWPELWQFLKVAQNTYVVNTSTRVSMPSLSNDIRAIETFIYAERLEKTGQLSLALTTYNSILKVKGIYGPYEEAQAAVINLLENKANELLADQKRVAEVPQKQYSSSEDSSNMGGRMRFDTRRLLETPQAKGMIEQAVAQQMAVYLAAEAKRKIAEAETPAKEASKK
ncbi:MAG: hypothetical protein ACSHX8_14395 [Opitutaceae bacterium]